MQCILFQSRATYFEHKQIMNSTLYGLIMHFLIKLELEPEPEYYFQKQIEKNKQVTEIKIVGYQII